MKIIFGWYNFKIKSYKPEEVGIKEIEDKNITIEVQQKCFHLFWIPFFSTKKVCLARKGNELYKLPPKETSLIIGKEKHKTPWYSFSLPILIVLGLLIFLLSRGYKSYRRYQHLKTEHAYSLTIIDKELENITTDHYIQIRKTEDWSNEQDIYLKVEEIDNDSLKLLPIKTRALPYAIKALYLKKHGNLETLTLSRNEIKEAICRDFETIHKRQEFGYPLLKSKDKYIIKAIKYIKGPIIKYNGNRHSSYRTVIKDGKQTICSSFGIGVRNVGFPAELVEIKNIKNNITWTNRLPEYIHTDSLNNRSFSLDGMIYNKNSEYNIMLLFRDHLNNDYKYILSKKYGHQRIERVIE